MLYFKKLLIGWLLLLQLLKVGALGGININNKLDFV